MKNDNALFYTCSLIEFIGRRQKQKRAYIVNTLGKSVVKRIYTHSDVLQVKCMSALLRMSSRMKMLTVNQFFLIF